MTTTKKSTYVFNSVTDKFYRFVHPLKQKNLKSIIENLPITVEQLWVFGSSVTHNHYPWSDLDIFVLGNLSEDDRKNILISAGCEVDLIVKTEEEFDEYRNQFGHCFYRIFTEGVKYYDKEWF